MTKAPFGLGERCRFLAGSVTSGLMDVVPKHSAVKQGIHVQLEKWVFVRKVQEPVTIVEPRAVLEYVFIRPSRK